VQEQAQGGLRPATRRRLARAAKDFASARPPAAGPSAVKAGTRLLREWQGVIHEVIVQGSLDPDLFTDQPPRSMLDANVGLAPAAALECGDPPPNLVAIGASSRIV
jgi:hypothetical protein